MFSYSIDSVVERLETKAVTCTQLSSCSQAYVDFKWVCFICQLHVVSSDLYRLYVRLVVTSILEPLEFASYSDI